MEEGGDGKPREQACSLGMMCESRTRREKNRHEKVSVVEEHLSRMASYVTFIVAKGHEQRPKMRFVTALTAPQTKAADKSKNIKEWSLPEAEAGLREMRTKTLCEYPSWERPWTKPYFDTEPYLDARPSEEAIEAIRERSLLSMDIVMEDQEG